MFSTKGKSNHDRKNSGSDGEKDKDKEKEKHSHGLRRESRGDKGDVKDLLKDLHHLVEHKNGLSKEEIAPVLRELRTLAKPDDCALRRLSLGDLDPLNPPRSLPSLSH